MSERLNDYFAREAAEYLDQLDGLLALPGAPDADSLLRLATGVRGSAQMGEAESVALEAGKLEDAARSLLSGEVAWTAELRAVAVQTVHDLKAMVAALVQRGTSDLERVIISAPERKDDPAPFLPALEGGVVPIDALFFDDSGPHIVEAGGPGAVVTAPTRVVPIEELLLRGDDALREALSLRPTLEGLARGDAVRGRALDDLVRELFDLVEQGMATGSRTA